MKRVVIATAEMLQGNFNSFAESVYTHEPMEDISHSNHHSFTPNLLFSSFLNICLRMKILPNKEPFLEARNKKEKKEGGKKNLLKEVDV